MTTFSKEIEDAIADASKEAYYEGFNDGYNEGSESVNTGCENCGSNGSYCKLCNKDEGKIQ